MEDKGIKLLALIRGINVGGKNILQKKQLINAFKDLGNYNIRTYIQSGNILYRSLDTDPNYHVEKIENQDVLCNVIFGGELSDHKGINLPGSILSVEAMTEKDKKKLDN